MDMQLLLNNQNKIYQYNILKGKYERRYDRKNGIFTK